MKAGTNLAYNRLTAWNITKHQYPETSYEHAFTGDRGTFRRACAGAYGADGVSDGQREGRGVPDQFVAAYFVAIDLGYFKELNIEPETIKLSGPPNIAALMTNQIEVASVLVTLEGLNADVKKPGVAMYVAMHSQTSTYIMEQFVVREGLADKVKTLKDFKGLKLMSAPGPANLNTAKGILAKVVASRMRLHHRPARHGPACQRHEGRYLRRRLHAGALRDHHAQHRRRKTVEAGVIAKICPW